MESGLKREKLMWDREMRPLGGLGVHCHWTVPQWWHCIWWVEDDLGHVRRQSQQDMSIIGMMGEPQGMTFPPP